MNSHHDGQDVDTTHTAAASTSDETPSRTSTTDTTPADASSTSNVELNTIPAQTSTVDNIEGVDVGEELEIGPQPAPMEMKEEGEVSLAQMELLEHSPETVMDANGVVHEAHDQWALDPECELKRVKVYELVGARWVDQGTAFCFGQFHEDSHEAILVARSEKDYNHVVLQTKIRGNDVYQRQQETLIVWTEPTGVDYALSFQDPEGCSEVWSFIVEVQRHLGNDIAYSSPPQHSEPEGLFQVGTLPRPQLGIIGEIERAIKGLVNRFGHGMKEKICEHVQSEDYVRQLIDLLQIAEDLESLENLHALCSLMQTLLMLNEHSMYDYILDDDLFFGVLGMLEYDPDFPEHKANYREYLDQQSHFHQPIPFRDPAIQRKVHHTYRLQFLKDVVLARALDDSTFNVLNTSIIFNQVDIIQHVQHDARFLRDIVGLFVAEDKIPSPSKKTPTSGPQKQQHGPLPPNQIVISLSDEMEVDSKSEDRQCSNPTTWHYYQTHYAYAPPHDMSEADINLRREVIILLQQLCVMGKGVQLPARMALFRTLVERGILFAIHWALSLPEKDETNKSMISAAGEVLTTLLDHDLNGVRVQCMRHVDGMEAERTANKKYADKAESLLELLCRIMANSKDLAIQSQIGDALKTWLELPPPVEPPNPSGEAAGSQKPPIRREGDVSERFIDFFYKNCTRVLFKPLLELTEWKNVHGPILPLFREEASRFTSLCDLLHLSIQQHSSSNFFFVVSSNILSRVASLLKVRDKHLRHAAFRIFRLILQNNNQHTLNHMCKLDVFKPILDLTLQESRRDNLLSCSCHEFFDSMRRDNNKELIKFCMTHHEAEIRRLAKTPLGSQRFELFIQRYEINCQPPPATSEASDRPLDPRTWAGPSRGMLDAEEEDYFNGDDDDDEDQSVPQPTAPQQQWPQQKSPKTNTLLPSVPISNLKRRRKPGMLMGSNKPSLQPRQPPPPRPPRAPSSGLGSLLEYGDEDEDESLEGTDGEVTAPTTPSTSTVSNPPTPLLPAASLPTPNPAKPHPLVEDEEDEEDQALERAFQSQAAQPAPSPSATPPSSLFSKVARATASSLAPMRLSEKRRRNDTDEDDSLMERLRKTKRVDTGGVTSKEGAPIKAGKDDAPRKMKVKIGGLSLGAFGKKQVSQTADATVTHASAAKPGNAGSTAVSTPGTKKEGDNG